MLSYPTRIRDLVHKYVVLTEIERKIIDHPLYQRLRYVAQTDVTFLVYPSMTGSRFVHSLGTCHLAGRMAESIARSRLWRTFMREFKQETSIGRDDEFVQLCRLYALLHDIGHFPLSHLFEKAFENYAKARGHDVLYANEAWTGKPGFEKLHESMGAALVERIAQDVGLTELLREPLIMLMGEKVVDPGHPLRVVKLVVDSEIDADRMDSIRRDGLLAGSEYGNYDLGRLSTSAFLGQDEHGWVLAYSEKALTSLEAMLLDRYRSYQWIHFHHRAVTLKSLTGYLIERLLQAELITKEQFNPNDPALSLRDDFWLWSLIRAHEPNNDTDRMVRDAVLHREKQNVVNLWKGRIEYHALDSEVKKAARVEVTGLQGSLPGVLERYYCESLGASLALVYRVEFKALGRDAVLLYDEATGKFSGRTLRQVSELVDSLPRIWAKEPKRHIVLVGKNILRDRKRLQRQWINAEARWELR